MNEEANLDLDLDQNGDDRIARVMIAEACGYTRQGAPTITIDCDSPRSLQREIDRLKAELDDIAARAQAALTDGPQPAPQPTQESARQDKPSSAKPHLDADLLVGDLMTREVKTVRRNDRVSVADELMKVGRFRHVVVLDDDGGVAGVVSHRDIVFGALAWTLGQGRAAHDKALESYPVKDVMSTNVVAVDSATPLREAAAVMRERKLGCLPVVDGDELVGILSEGDFLHLLAS